MTGKFTQFGEGSRPPVRTGYGVVPERTTF